MTDPVPVRDAATVALLRDGPSGVEAWLLTRVAQMTFAAGQSVFPGGRVDDGDATLPAAGADFAALAARFGCAEVTAHALVGAAVRETFEEAGVLLTVPPADRAEFRAEVEAGSLAFADLLATHSLALDAAAVQPWARWVTPEGEVRRYDTRFFVAALPPGAQARGGTSEASEASWHPAAEAIEQAQRGERALLPPTVAVLSSLVPYPDVAAVLRAADTRDLTPVSPVLNVAPDGSASVTLPDGQVFAIPRSMAR